MKCNKSFLISSVSCLAIMLSLGACATIQKGRDIAVEQICANKRTLLAVAIANGDIASVKAIEAYCPEPEVVASEAAKVASEM